MPSELIRLTNWQAYLWDEALDWLYCYDLQDEKKDTAFSSFGAFG